MTVLRPRLPVPVANTSFAGSPPLFSGSRARCHLPVTAEGKAPLIGARDGEVTSYYFADDESPQALGTDPRWVHEFEDRPPDWEGE